MACDVGRGVTVLYGGSSNYRAALADTHEWDGMRWHYRGHGLPGARSWSAMTYDSGRQIVVLFGGRINEEDRYLDDTWAWDGRARAGARQSNGNSASWRRNAVRFRPENAGA